MESSPDEKTFFDPHPGFLGASIPIPIEVKRIADELNGKKRSLCRALDDLRAVTKGKVSVYKDSIMLELGEPSGTRHIFRVIRFK